MSNYFYTATELIASIKRRAMVPTDQTTFTAQDFLDFASEEMNMGIVPTVVQLHEDYYLYEVLIPLVDGQTKYEIPYRAIGNKVKNIALVDSNSNYGTMTRIGIEDVADYNWNNNVYAYYIASNQICLVPQTNNQSFNGSSLSVSIYLRPNGLVPSDEVAVISNINRNTGVIQVSNFPTAFSQTELLDFVQYQSPHKVISFDVQATSMSSGSSTITFDTDDIPDTLVVGDRICLATQTDIPQIPSDMHVILAARVASRLLEAIGDTEGLQNANQKLAELEAKTPLIINNRVEDSPRKIVNRNATIRKGALYRRGYRRW